MCCSMQKSFQTVSAAPCFNYPAVLWAAARQGPVSQAELASPPCRRPVVPTHEAQHRLAGHAGEVRRRFSLQNARAEMARHSICDNMSGADHGRPQDTAGRRKARPFKRPPAEGSAFRHEKISHKPRTCSHRYRNLRNSSKIHRCQTCSQRSRNFRILKMMH